MDILRYISCHALTPTVLWCPSAYEMQYAILCNSCQYITCTYINIIYTQSSCYSSLAITHNQPTWANKQSDSPSWNCLNNHRNTVPDHPKTVHTAKPGCSKTVQKFQHLVPILGTKCTAISAPNTPTICMVLK